MIFRRSTLTLAAAFLCSGIGAQAAVQLAHPAAGTTLTVAATTDRLIVKYRTGTGPTPTAQGKQAMLVASNRHGVQVNALRQMASGAHVFKMNRRMSHGDMDALAQSLKAGDPNVEFAEPDRLLQAAYVPNDSLYSQQWALSDVTGGIRAPSAWDRATGAGVTVAVIDTGYRPHADLVANLLPGYDFITDTLVSGDNSGRDADASDPGDGVSAGYCGAGTPATNSSWHGTHVAGIIAAATNNGVGVAGVARSARILPLRALGKCGGYTSDIADAIVWAVGGTVAGLPVNPNPAKVINMSLGGGGACGITTQNAINTARSKGAVVVVAAGNSNADASTSSPANCSGVVVVAATGKTGGKASYSNTGAIVSLAAPGGDTSAGILSTLNAGTKTPGSDSYVAYMGTSMATPVVAGVAALMLSVNKTLTPDQVATMLKSTARAFPSPCPKCGTGLVDANAAVLAALGTAAPAPAPTPAPAPGPVALAEVEGNDTIAKAQVVATLPTTVTGTVATNTDLDYYRATIAAGKKLVATLTEGSTSAFALGVFSTAGSQLLLLPGSTGGQSQVTVTNTGTSAVTVLLRVSRTSGALGAYKLALTN
jgi:serine protease